MMMGSLIYDREFNRTKAGRREREREAEGEEEEERVRMEERGEENLERRPILLGMGLKLVKGSEKDEEEEEEGGIRKEERELFKNILEMVSECWDEL
jgi:hypothetical protein